MGSNFIYLASASPRRKALLDQIGVAFVARPADIPETPEPDEAPQQYVDRVARAKAAAVWSRLGIDEPRRPVLAADTAVVVDGRILGKPRDRDEAEAMLASLSGRQHDVWTAVAVQYDDRVDTCLTGSKVRFRATTFAERTAYCATEEPLDKAGAYGIQGLGAVFIVDLIGSYSAVMGLPLAETAALLAPYALPAWLCGEGLPQ
jgi:septum formation protein